MYCKSIQYIQVNHLKLIYRSVRTSIDNFIIQENELNIVLENKDGETSSNQVGTARLFEPEMKSLDIIIANFNDIFGNIDGTIKTSYGRPG
ncbi:MAG: hypothetical protein Q4E02_02595 [Lagierella massiliensis]|nr:hypothetical protein [Lagierella massiliensis]